MRIPISAAPVLLSGVLALSSCCGAGEREAELEALAAELDRAQLELLASQLELEKCEARGETLLADVEALERAAAPPSWGGGRVGQPGPESDLRCVAVGDHYQVSPAVGEELGQLSMSIRVVPHYRDGEPRGLKLFGIPGDSLPASCGFANGDVVVSLNGLPLSNPSEALEAYAEVTAAGEALFSVERDRQAHTIRIVAADGDPAAP
jgi:hypothetical protein